MTDIFPASRSIGPAQRAALKRQRPCLIWLTGLSGAGKSTLADLLDQRLAARGAHTYVLDGDNVRGGLCRDLGFSRADRIENMRRVGEVGRMFVDAGLITIAAFISPLRSDRALVRALFGPDEFIEVFVDAPLERCERRDPKGLYRKARAGALPEFTGIGSPYEAPEAPELRLDTDARAPAQCVAELVAYLEARGFLDFPPAPRAQEELA